MTDLRGTIRATADIAGRRGRSDLVERLEQAQRQRTDSTVRVVVVGDFKSGKSSLVNALVGSVACPVDDDLATAVITSVAHAPAPTASVMYKSEQGEALAPATVSVDDLGPLVERGHHDGHALGSISVRVPSPFLAGGLELIDTPVLGGLDSPEAVATLMGLPFVDALLFVTDTSQEFTAPELSYLCHAWSSGTRVICVMSKIDLHPQWRRILEIDQGHLRTAGFEPPIIATSVRLNELAATFGDQAYADESGIPALRDYLIRQVVIPANAGRNQAALAVVVGVLDQIESVLRAEQAALAGGEGPTVAELRSSYERATELLTDRSRWRHVLNDGVEDLSRDVQHELTVRLRDLGHQAGEMVDAGDPVVMEEEYSNWVSRGAASIVSECFQLVARRGEELSDLMVAELSSATAGLLVSLELALATQATDQLSFSSHSSSADDDEDKVLVAIGGAWGGMEPLLGVAGMIGLGVGGVVAAPVLLAVAGVAGILTVGRAFKQERRKALSAERQRAKDEYKEYLDEVQVRFTKALDDAVRSLSRQLRDGANSRVAELQLSTRTALEATERAPTVDEAAKTAEVAELERELAEVAALREQARDEVKATMEAFPAPAGDQDAQPVTSGRAMGDEHDG